MLDLQVFERFDNLEILTLLDVAVELRRPGDDAKVEKSSKEGRKATINVSPTRITRLLRLRSQQNGIVSAEVPRSGLGREAEMGKLGEDETKVGEFEAVLNGVGEVFSSDSS
jgi:hypothetical protein